MTLIGIFLFYVCPTMGSILATIMFAAPVYDLRRALLRGSLGTLDPFPWVFAAGNCLGWIIYGYLKGDPFLVAANLPGFLVSVWLNYGAAKLQYHRIQTLRAERMMPTTTSVTQEEEEWDASPPIDDEDHSEIEEELNHYDDSDPEIYVFSPQETAFFRMMVAWAIVATYTTWFTDRSTASFIAGWTVNVNLVFFYGAPLNTIRTVVRTKDSTPIHRPTLTMNFINTSFWIMYGLACKNIIIVAPNATGLLLGVAQAVLCVLFPAKGASTGELGNLVSETAVNSMIPQPIAQEVDDFV